MLVGIKLISLDDRQATISSLVKFMLLGLYPERNKATLSTSPDFHPANPDLQSNPRITILNHQAILDGDGQDKELSSGMV